MTIPSPIAVLDVVALLVDVPEHGLVRGDLGTVVEQLGGGFFEVEFSDHDGRTCAELAVNGAVLQLHHRCDVSDDPDRRSDEEWLTDINRRAAHVASGDSHSQPWRAVRDGLVSEPKQRRRDSPK